MPYIITTRPVADPPNEHVAVKATILSRRAVATLDDAQAFTSGLVSGILPWPADPPATKAAAEQLWNLPESGGTVGPLPDGTVIEVERVEWGQLAILDAFNAR